MTFVEQIIKVASTYAMGRNRSLSRISTLVFGDGKVIGRLIDGKDLTTGRFQSAMQWFSDNWPQNIEWPAGIQRPSPNNEETAA